MSIENWSSLDPKFWVRLAAHTSRVLFVQVPTADVSVEGNAALNKCLWHKNGHVIAAGDDAGRIHLYELAEVLFGFGFFLPFVNRCYASRKCV
jgi:hypothetical protein